ncbi:MAG: hypothetical protein HY057_14375 [Rhodospirillales bacterium]|nr:hypothetical protein [Rhodospirillales bacterium]
MTELIRFGGPRVATFARKYKDHSVVANGDMPQPATAAEACGARRASDKVTPEGDAAGRVLPPSPTRQNPSAAFEFEFFFPNDFEFDRENSYGHFRVSRKRSLVCRIKVARGSLRLWAGRP